MRHTQTYNGHDSRVTEALANYYALRMTPASVVAKLLAAERRLHSFLLSDAHLGDALGTGRSG